MLELLKKGLPHLGTSGVTVLVLYGLLAGQVQQANTRADSAMMTAAQSKGVIDGISENLKFFMRQTGVEPLGESALVETVTVWRYVEVRDDSTLAPMVSDTFMLDTISDTVFKPIDRTPPGL